MDSPFTDPNWLAALPLAERAAILQDAERAPALEHTVQAAERVRRWRAETALLDEALFSERLASERLTSGLFLDAAAAPVSKLQELAPVPPDWLVELARAFSMDEASIPGAEENFGFLEVLRPLIAEGHSRLLQGLKSLAGQGHLLACDSIAASLLRHLLERLRWMVERTLILELHISRLEGQLSGDTPEDRFASFIASLRNRKQALAILLRYPVLAREAARHVDQWITTSLETLERLGSDRGEIVRHFFSGSDPGPLTALEPGRGDRHDGGRTVTFLTFAAGLQLVYKPRSLAVDAWFQELLVWLNERGARPELVPRRVLERDSYGWMELVTPAPCSSRREIERFYERQGAWVALFYALDANDFHWENLIAAGEHPVPVDLETLFQPMPPDLGPAENLAALTVLRSGLLPQRFRTGGAAALDVSGLGGAAGQKTPGRFPVDAGTDQMRLAPTLLESPDRDHRPRLAGETVALLDYRESVLRGFRAMYRLLAEHREGLLAPGGPLSRCDDLETRFLLRDTSVYAHLIHHSYHPDFLQSGLDRSRLFDRLWLDAVHRPHLRPVIQDEIADLSRGDTPRFGAWTSSTGLRTGTGRLLESFFSESGLARVRRRIAALGEEDLQRQVMLVEMSLSATRPFDERLSWAPRPLREERVPADRARLLAAAGSLGQRLAALAFREGGHVSWFHVQGTSDSRDLRPVDIDLYDGLPGMSLFYAHLADRTGDGAAEELARSALATLRWRIGHAPTTLGTIGAFSGWAGAIWALAHLGLLWQEPSLLAEAEQLAAERLSPLIDEDRHFDLIGGAAGAIAVLLSLHRHRQKSETLALALHCGEHLLAHARSEARSTTWPPPPQGGDVPLTGFGHGAAGFAWALSSLARVTGDPRFGEAARGALAYERSWYAPDRRNWPDLREDRKENGMAPFLHAWCHGAPGIGLGRLAMRRVLDDSELETEARAAWDSTLDEGFGGSHCLCHGDLGNLDLLLVAARELGDRSLEEKAGRLAAGILASIEDQGPRCGGRAGEEIPGLMTGLAGIGYGLLRAADPEHVPSVLLLEMPAAKGKSRA
jgi:type 2 lantibiotic biosynthesis protein LanM